MSNAKAKIVGYVRVSTARQGESGLGLDAQLSAIEAYAVSVNGEIAKVYREVESGRNNDRPQLAKAMSHAKRLKGKLCIAKLDRLGRNVHFISGLMQSKVDFVACDNPCANKLTVHILACVAENEAEAISARTVAALAAAKAKGTLLGSARPNHWLGRENIRLNAAKSARAAAAAKHQAEAEPIYSAVRPIIGEMKEQGASLQAIADRLNVDGFSTLRGLAWNRMQVSRLA